MVNVSEGLLLATCICSFEMLTDATYYATIALLRILYILGSFLSSGCGLSGEFSCLDDSV